MEAIDYHLMYDFKRYKNVETRRQADDVVKEVVQELDGKGRLQVKVEDEGPKRFAVSISVEGFYEPFYVKKTGKKIIPTMKKVKKALLRKIRRYKRQRISQKKRGLKIRAAF